MSNKKSTTKKVKETTTVDGKVIAAKYYSKALRQDEKEAIAGKITDKIYDETLNEKLDVILSTISKQATALTSKIKVPKSLEKYVRYTSDVKVIGIPKNFYPAVQTRFSWNGASPQGLFGGNEGNPFYRNISFYNSDSTKIVKFLEPANSPVTLKVSKPLLKLMVEFEKTKVARDTAGKDIVKFLDSFKSTKQLLEIEPEWENHVKQFIVSKEQAKKKSTCTDLVPMENYLAVQSILKSFEKIVGKK